MNIFPPKDCVIYCCKTLPCTVMKWSVAGEKSRNWVCFLLHIYYSVRKEGSHRQFVVQWGSPNSQCTLQITYVGIAADPVVTPF